VPSGRGGGELASCLSGGVLDVAMVAWLMELLEAFENLVIDFY
jgi:hypothetical protein